MGGLAALAAVEAVIVVSCYSLRREDREEAARHSARAGPATSPSFISYSGPFEYRTNSGTLTMRETGVTTNNAEGVVTAYQEIVQGTGLYAGASGHLFVSGHKSGGMITTFVKGEICYP